MIREYKTVEEISGPLMMVRMVENVTYDELVEIELHDGSLRRVRETTEQETSLVKTNS